MDKTTIIKKTPVSPGEVTKFLFEQFEGVKEAAISHVVANGQGGNLYVVLLHVEGKDGTAASGKAELSSEPRVDEFDRDLSEQLMDLFGGGLAFDGCDIDPNKPHCAGSGDGYRHRGKHSEPKVPGDQGHKTAKKEGHAKKHAFVSSEVPVSKIQSIFKTLASIGKFGVGE
jgi:hypothetical protein